MKTSASQTNRPTNTPPVDPAVPVDPRKIHPQPAGGSPQTPGKKDEVDETSEESFPASDPPAWTPISHV